MVINMVCDQTTGANQPTRTHDVIYKNLHTSIVLIFFSPTTHRMDFIILRYKNIENLPLLRSSLL